MNNHHLTSDQRRRGDDRLLHALFPELCPPVQDEETWYERRDPEVTIASELLDEWDEEAFEPILTSAAWHGR